MSAIRIDDCPVVQGKRFRFLTPTVKSFDPEGEMIIEGIANLAEPDRWGEVCVPSGWDLVNFKKNPIILLEHDRDRPIGTCIQIEIRSDGLYYRAQIGDPRKAPLTQDQIKARSLLAQGILKTNSVGFLPHVIEYDEDTDELRYTNAELLEISVVAIPMQQDSLITSVKNWRNKMAGENAEKGGKEYSTKEIMEAVKGVHDAVKDCHGMVKDIHDGKHPGAAPADGASGDDADADDKKALQDKLTKAEADLAAAKKDLADTVAAFGAYKTKAESFVAKLREQGVLKPVQ